MRVKKYDEKSKIYTLKTKNPEDNKESADIEATKEELSDQIRVKIRLIHSTNKNTFGEISVGINDPISSLNNIIKV